MDYNLEIEAIMARRKANRIELITADQARALGCMQQPITVSSILSIYSNPNPLRIVWNSHQSASRYAPMPTPQPVKETPKMTTLTLEHLKQVSQDTTASAAARDAANLLIAREEAARAEKKAAQQAEAKKQLEQLFLKEDGEVRESELIAMAKRAGVKVLKAAAAGAKEKVRLVKLESIEEIRELLADGWTIGRALDHLYFEMLAPEQTTPKAKPSRRGK